MKTMLMAVGLIVAYSAGVSAESGELKSYDALKNIYTSVRPDKPFEQLLFTGKEPLPAFAAPGSAVPGCPAVDEIKPEWIEHTDPADIPARIKEHLGSSFIHADPISVMIHSIPYYFGVVRRSDFIAQADLETGCWVTGTAAYYVIGEEGNPEINFNLIMSEPGQEKTLANRLSELRWFDLKDGHRHRWFNLKLAARSGWLVDEYGRPTPDYRPIETFTSAINDLY